MTVRSRLLPLAALLLAVATGIAMSVALSGPAGAIVSATPSPGAGACETNGRVNAVAYLGGTIYLGGSFTAVDGTTRNRLAACDAATGNLLSWNPNANGVVRALKVSPAGTRVYVGGDFTAVGGAARARVAALSPTSGGAFGWSPYVNDSVKAVTTSNSGATVYVGGDFDSAEGAGRRRLAAFNATSGNISTTFKPTVSNGTGNFATVLSMDVSPRQPDPLLQRRLRPGQRHLAPQRGRRVDRRRHPAGLEPGLHRRHRRRHHGLGLGQHGVRGRPLHRRLRPGLRPHRRRQPGLERRRPTATSRPWPSPPRSCTWAATSPPSAGPAAATWPP